MTITLIQTVKEFKDISQKLDTFILLKHSITCPISSAAKNNYEEFSNHADLPLFMLYVQEARELSNTIAEEFHVKHESPQVLLFKNNEVTWHNSHSSITVESLQQHTK